MKHASLAAVLLALAACLMLTPARSSAQQEVTEFETLAKSACTPMPSCAIPERGTVTCPGAGVEAAPISLDRPGSER